MYVPGVARERVRLRDEPEQQDEGAAASGVAERRSEGQATAPLTGGVFVRETHQRFLRDTISFA